MQPAGAHGQELGTGAAAAPDGTLRGKLCECPPPHWPVALEIAVAWGEMDAFAHVNNAVYLRWFESARIAYFLAVGLLDRMAPDGVGPILARATIDFRKPVTFPDRLVVSARVSELRNTSFLMAYKATSHAQAGAVVATGDAVVVMMSYRTGEKTPLTDDLRQRIAELESPRS